MIVFVSVSTRQAFFIFHPLPSTSMHFSFTLQVHVFLSFSSSHHEHFIKKNVPVTDKKNFGVDQCSELVWSSSQSTTRSLFFGWQCMSVIVYYISDRYHNASSQITDILSLLLQWWNAALVVSMTTKGYLHI